MGHGSLTMECISATALQRRGVSGCRSHVSLIFDCFHFQRSSFIVSSCMFVGVLSACLVVLTCLVVLRSQFLGAGHPNLSLFTGLLGSVAWLFRAPFCWSLFWSMCWARIVPTLSQNETQNLPKWSQNRRKIDSRGQCEKTSQTRRNDTKRSGPSKRSHMQSVHAGAVETLFSLLGSFLKKVKIKHRNVTADL